MLKIRHTGMFWYVYKNMQHIATYKSLYRLAQDFKYLELT